MQLLANLSQVRRSDLPDWLPDHWKLHQPARLHILQDTAAQTSWNLGFT